MSIVKKITHLMTIALLSGTTLFAQTEQNQTPVSNAELEKFATAFQGVQKVNQSTQQEMVSVVEAGGMTVEEFNALIQAKQNPDQEVEASDEKLEKFEVASKGINELQVKAQAKMEKQIVDTGLSVERYQEIAAKLQTDPELQQKIQEYMQGSQGNG